MWIDTLKSIWISLCLLLMIAAGAQASEVAQQAQSRKLSTEQKARTPASKDAAQATAPSVQVLAVGDSLMGGVAQMLAWRIKRDGRSDMQLIDRHKLSTGLANTRFYDWPAQLATLVSEKKPEVVLIMLGANDASMGLRENGKTYAYGSEGWRAAYRQRAMQMITLARADGASVIWIGLPQMAKPEYSAQIQMQNAIYAQVAHEAGIPFIDSASLLADDKGAYAASITEQGKTVSLRAKDGVHLAPRGGDILARATLAKLGSTERVALR